MNILLVNDDGYKAEGFVKLKHALEEKGHLVTAVSTDEDVSSSGSGYNMLQKWIVNVHHESGMPIFVLQQGTPIDCIDLGENLMNITNNPIDLVLVGIN